MRKSDDELRRKVISSKDGRFKAMIATAENMEECAKVLSDGFSGLDEQPIFPKMFPHLHTPEGQRVMAQRLRDTIAADPTCYFVKVVDTLHDNKIVTQGRWIIRETDPAPVSFKGSYWDSEEDRLEGETETRIMFDLRRKAINETPGRVYCISALNSDPAYQGKGGGRLWAQWGLEEADAEGSLAVVEASPRAIRYYEKQGFQYHYMVDCGDQMPEKWRKKGTHQISAWMTRQPRAVVNGA